MVCANHKIHQNAGLFEKPILTQIGDINNHSS